MFKGLDTAKFQQCLMSIKIMYRSGDDMEPVVSCIWGTRWFDCLEKILLKFCK